VSDCSCQLQGFLQLNESIHGTKKNVSVSNLFSSCEPPKDFTKKKLPVLDTIRENKAELLPNIWKLKEKRFSLPTLFVMEFIQGIICLIGKKICNFAFY
jgi:hypothetical protein